MNKDDLIAMLGNISHSFYEMQYLLGGLSYVLGIAFFYRSVMEFKKIIMARRSARQTMISPLVFLLVGVLLLYLPTSIRYFSNTAFGPVNILSFAHYDKFDIFASMRVLLQCIGIIWFVRGSVLLTRVSEPSRKGEKPLGHKGLTFIFAGILAINFDYTVEWLTTVLNKIMSWI